LRDRADIGGGADVKIKKGWEGLAVAGTLGAIVFAIALLLKIIF
jgi:hypothetical protein